MRQLLKSAFTLAFALLFVASGTVFAQTNVSNETIRGSSNDIAIDQVFNNASGSDAHFSDVRYQGDGNFLRLDQEDAGAINEIDALNGSDGNVFRLDQNDNVNADIDLNSADNNKLRGYNGGRFSFASQGETTAQRARLDLDIANSDGNTVGLGQSNDVTADLDFASDANNNTADVFQKGGAGTQTYTEVDISSGDRNTVDVQQGMNGGGALQVEGAFADVDIAGEPSDDNMVTIEQFSDSFDDSATVDIQGASNQVVTCQTNAASVGTCSNVTP